jgi:hypothetical protein
MVIMPTRNVIDQAIRINLAFERWFSLDVHVRTPYQIMLGLKEGDCDWFLREVMEKGKVLYEAPYGTTDAVGLKNSRARPRRTSRSAGLSTMMSNVVRASAPTASHPRS